MLKIGLLTIHHSYNYGAVLQAFAMQTILTELEYKCEIIDYDCTTFKKDRQLLIFPTSIWDIIRDIRTVLNWKKFKQRKYNFEKFISENYILSDKKWMNECNLNKEDYDIVITGSDQTFCLHLRNNPDEMKAFFLGDCREIKKISYGSSMGEKFSEITEDEKAWMADRLKEYSFLSVREKKSAEYIKKLIGIRPKIVIDPTMLLSRSIWESLIENVKPIEGEYILFYTVISEQWVVDYAEKMSQKLNIRVIAPHHKTRFEMHNNFLRYDNVGPDGFLSLIKNAKYVITTSFHATIFSILFNVPFQSLILGEGNRLHSLLETMNLLNHEINPEKLCNLEENCFYSDFEEANKIIVREQLESITYLKEALQL